MSLEDYRNHVLVMAMPNLVAPQFVLQSLDAIMMPLGSVLELTCLTQDHAVVMLTSIVVYLFAVFASDLKPLQ